MRAKLDPAFSELFLNIQFLEVETYIVVDFVSWPFRESESVVFSLS